MASNTELVSCRKWIWPFLGPENSLNNIAHIYGSSQVWRKSEEVFGFDGSREDPQEGGNNEHVGDKDHLNEALAEREQIIHYVAIWAGEYQEWGNVTKETAHNLDF